MNFFYLNLRIRKLLCFGPKLKLIYKMVTRGKDGKFACQKDPPAAGTPPTLCRKKKSVSQCVLIVGRRSDRLRFLRINVYGSRKKIAIAFGNVEIFKSNDLLFGVVIVWKTEFERNFFFSETLPSFGVAIFRRVETVGGHVGHTARGMWCVRSPLQLAYAEPFICRKIKSIRCQGTLSTCCFGSWETKCFVNVESQTRSLLDLVGIDRYDEQIG